jgi:hypothetical protein
MSDKKVQVEREDGLFEVVLREDDFTIDPSHIDSELCKFGQTMLQYGEIETELQVEVERKKIALEKLKADLDIGIRAQAAKDGVKLTENKIGTQICNNKSKLDLEYELAVSRGYHEMMRWAMRALQGKKDCLTALAYRERQLMKADEWN